MPTALPLTHAFSSTLEMTVFPRDGQFPSIFIQIWQTWIWWGGAYKLYVLVTLSGQQASSSLSLSFHTVTINAVPSVALQCKFKPWAMQCDNDVSLLQNGRPKKFTTTHLDLDLSTLLSVTQYFICTKSFQQECSLVDTYRDCHHFVLAWKCTLCDARFSFKETWNQPGCCSKGYRSALYRSFAVPCVNT